MLHPRPTEPEPTRDRASDRQPVPSQPLGSETAEQMAQFVMVVAPAAVSLAQQLWSIAVSQRKTTRQREEAADAAKDERVDAAEPVVEAEPGTLERMLTFIGETLYDYSGGAYGMQPPPLRTLRRARKQTEREVRVAARANDATDDAPRRGALRLPLIILGLLVGGGAIAIAVLQREQLRAAAIQVAGASKQTLRQVATRKPISGLVTHGTDKPRTPSMPMPIASAMSEESATE